MRMLRKVFVSIVLMFIVKFLFVFSFFGNLEHKAQDTLFRLRGAQPVNNDILIIAIDDQTFQSLNRPWPFPREFHAHLIDNLTKAGARQIIFDVEFTEDSNPLSDLTLAKKAADAGNVIFAGKHLREVGISEHYQVQTPISPIMQRQLAWGIVNIPWDDDGIIRYYTLYETIEEEKFYSLGIAAMGNFRYYQPDWAKTIRHSPDTLHVADYAIPIVNRNKTLINYFGPAYTFRMISYSSVLDDSLTTMPGQRGIEIDEFHELAAAGAFRDKIVLIGATVEELHDKFPTPFGSQLTPGVEIHANFLEMVHQRRFLYHINPWLFLLIQLVGIAAIYILITWLKPQISLIITVFLVLAYLGFGYFMFVEKNLLLPLFQVAVIFILLYMLALISHYLKTQREKKFIRSAFQQYLAPELVTELLNNPKNLKYGGSLQEITVLISDVRSYTTYAERHKPEETVLILKEYLTEMVKVVIRNKGIVDKFVGDEIMALYGTPVLNPDHAYYACRTALEMYKAHEELKVKWIQEGKDPFEIGIGITTGTAVVGNLGSEQIFDYTAIGDTINLGARLEALNKEHETTTHIIISEDTLEKVKDRVEVRFLDDAKIRGKEKTVKIYELLNILS